LQEPKKIHGINFLENREKILIVKETNQNDVVKLIGKPHITSISEPNKWIYFQRTITRGKLHKLGRNVLKENNVLELNFDKYGVLKKKKLYKKEDMNKVVYSKNETKNEVTQKSFVGKFLSSIKQKMYGKRKF
jgi:outer membrane protein assembly factor BamE (lipoprotein component of BamABCDE complex)